MKNLDLKKVNKVLLIFFLVLQPILELFLAIYRNNMINIAGVSIPTIIRYGLLALMLAIAICTNINRKSTKFFILYAIVSLIYIVLHYINIRNFDISLLGNSTKKSFITESIYISKLFVPICIVYLVYILKPTYKEVKIVILSVVTIICLVVIISNLFGFDYISYSFEENSRVQGSIINWFDKDLTYSDWRVYTSRGLYQSGNELSAICALLLPTVLWICFKEKNNCYFLIYFAQIITMLLFGTRVSVYGAIGISGIILCLYVFKSIKDKTKINWIKILIFTIIAVLFSIVFYFSPFVNRVKVGEGVKNTFEQEKQKIEIIKEEPKNDIEYIEQNYVSKMIPYEVLTKTYNYEEHPEFWKNTMDNVDFNDRNNNRKLKTLILKDIMQTKNGKFDKILGVGSLDIYAEKDYISQYFYVGALGVILFLLPFVILAVIAIIKILLNILKSIDEENIIYVCSLIGAIGIAWLAGHVVDVFLVNIYIGFISGIILINIKGKNEEHKLDKYFRKIYSDSEDNFKKELEQRLIKNKKTFIVTANPETIMMAEKNEQLKKALLDDETIIVPDGIGIIIGANNLNYNIRETITGVDTSKELLRLCNINKKSLYLFGAEQSVIEKMKEMIETEYPDINLVGAKNGYIEDDKKVSGEIEQLKPDVVMVALGIPRQELFIYDNLKEIKSGILIGVGGTFDVLSGNKKRAPKIFIKLRIEWLYRIISEPKRIKRFIQSNIKYLFDIYR